MLVRKINSNWSPSENRFLKVGELVEITDPYKLILDGDVEGVDEEGNTISAYDLYGIVTGREMEEFKDWKALKAAQVEQRRLLKEQAELEEFAASQRPAPALEPETQEVAQPDYDSMPWNDLVSKSKEKGLYKVGMKKEQVIEALKNA